MVSFGKIAHMTTTVNGIDGLRDLVGTQLGNTAYMEVTQERVNLFAEATGDHQWIHVDPERARRESPFGGPIAHGYLTLSLIPVLLPQVLVVHGISMGVNYGCEKVRFPSPVPVGAKLRMSGELVGLEEVTGGVQFTVRATLETEGATKPSCVADVVYRYYA
jgi:acyl dehydratase